VSIRGSLALGLCVALMVAGAALIVSSRLKARAERLAAAAAALTAKKPDIAVTIREGLRREEVAQLMQSKGITSFTEFMDASAGKEGTLYPDTYRFFPNTAAADVVKTLTTTYTTRVGDLNPTAEDLVLASIIEREAANETERPLIAGVYKNRLRIGMKLDADPTVQYGKDSLAFAKLSPTAQPTFTFWEPIFRADYQGIDSPYNTYRTNSLPPQPICSPRRSSIVAAQNPASHNNFYFVHKTDGRLLMARTLEEHNRNIAN